MTTHLRLIDTHAHLHLSQFDSDRAAVLERAATAEVRRMIEIGYDLDSSRAAVGMAASHSHIYAVVGVQPNHLNDLPEDWLEQVRTLAAHPRVVAIGEIGMDHHWKKSPPEVQEAAFRAQLDLARELDLPVVIHSREARADTLRILRDGANGVRGVMHSFSEDWECAQACLDIGFYLSLSGPVTFGKATTLHEVAQRAPLDRLLIETDSPYLAPHPHRGRRNEPAHVRLVAARIAELRGIALADVTEATWQNAAQLFRLPLHS